MLSGYLLNLNKKKEFSNNILNILKANDLDKLKYDILYILNNKIFSNDELIEKILDNDLFDVFQVLIKNKILFFDNLKINKLFAFDFSKKNKYTNIIIENMEINELVNLISLLTYKENNDEVLFEIIIKKIINITNDKDNIDFIKRIINDCCFNNKISYLEIITYLTKIKLNYDNSEPLYKIVTSHLPNDMSDIFKLAILKGANVKDREISFLIEAINFNKISLVEILIDKYKVPVNIHNDLPIRKAYDTGNWDLLIKILDKSTSETPIYISRIFNLENFINNIKIFPVKSEKIDSDNDTCSISIEKINLEELYVKCSVCKNNFKKNYLTEWLYTSKLNNNFVNCPICRSYWNNYRIYKNSD